MVTKDEGCRLNCCTKEVETPSVTAVTALRFLKTSEHEFSEQMRSLTPTYCSGTSMFPMSGPVQSCSEPSFPNSISQVIFAGKVAKSSQDDDCDVVM